MAENKNLRLKKHFSIVAHTPNIVELRHGVWNPVSFTLTDESESGLLFKLLTQLDGSLSPAELARREGVAEEEVQALLDHLIQLGAVETGSSNALDYYLDNIVPTLGRADGQAPVSTPVLLLGDSDLAAQIRGLLQESLPDLDLSLVGDDDPAMRALAENDTAWLMNGAAFQSKLKLFEEWRDRFLVVAMKIINPTQLRILNRVALACRIPWMHAVIDGPFLLVGPVFIPYRTACYECFETRVTMNLREASNYQQYKRALVEGQIKNGAMPVHPILLSLLASHTSFELLNYLLTETTFTVGKVLAIYLPTMEFSFNEVLRTVSCPACSPLPERDEQELYFDARAFLRQ